MFRASFSQIRLALLAWVALAAVAISVLPASEAAAGGCQIGGDSAREASARSPDPCPPSEEHPLGNHDHNNSQPGGVTTQTSTPFSCNNGYTFLPVSGNLYWGGYTSCGQPILEIHQDARLFYDTEIGWVEIDEIPLKICVGVSVCYSQKWAGGAPAGWYIIEFCHAGFNTNGFFNWHCHQQLFSN
jgi:hypothetical protein